jgi:hypothetical protein
LIEIVTEIIACIALQVGAVAKLFGQGASGLVYNATSRQIVATGCSSMCLSDGMAGGAQVKVLFQHG